MWTMHKPQENDYTVNSETSLLSFVQQMYQENIQPYHSYRTEDLDQIAENFFKKFAKPGIFMVRGEMGAGKTTFIAALSRKMGFEFQGSPTFSIVNEYASEKHRLFHFDLYRIDKEAELHELGFEEYLREDSWVFIEWPDIAERYLLDHAHTITLEDKGDHRVISF